MKILKGALILLGIIALIVMGVLMGKFVFDTQLLIGAAQRYDQGSKYINPIESSSVIIGLAAAGSFLLGLGLGLPRRTAAAVRADALEGVSSQREAAIRARAAGEEPRA